MITKKTARDGIISNTEVSIDMASDEMPDISELQQLAFFQSTEDRIGWLKDHLKQAAEEAGWSRARYATDAIRAFDDALRHLGKITDPKAKKHAMDAAYYLLNACQSLWRVDVKQIEPEVMTGARTRKGGAKGREARTQEANGKRERWQCRADQLRAELGLLGRWKKKVADIMEAEGLGASDTIRKSII
jgi:hypothetical protein